MSYTTTNANINSADYRINQRPRVDIAKCIEITRRTIRELEAAGFPTAHYVAQLARYEAMQSEVA